MKNCVFLAGQTKTTPHVFLLPYPKFAVPKTIEKAVQFGL